MYAMIFGSLKNTLEFTFFLSINMNKQAITFQATDNKTAIHFSVTKILLKPYDSILNK